MTDSENLGVLCSGEFFGPDERLGLIAEMRDAPRYPASITNKGEYSVNPGVRNTSRVRVTPSAQDLVLRSLIELKPRLESRFGRSLGECQEPQFLAYSKGHFFRAHRDRGGPQEPEHVGKRSLSVVILLNPGDYDGGVLVLHDMGVPGSKMEIKGRPGGFIAFHPLELHEVTPVTRGERYSVASWFERPRGT